MQQSVRTNQFILNTLACLERHFSPFFWKKKRRDQMNLSTLAGISIASGVRVGKTNSRETSEQWSTIRASKSSSILDELAKKREKKTKNSYPTETLSTSSSILVFYPEGDAGYLCLALSASHVFLDFGETVGFHPFFASYFVLHNSYIRILAIHR